MRRSLVVKNENGFDPELDYTAVDNPIWDCTDAAHPAWWRGNKQGVEGMVKRVNEWLDKPLDEMMKGTSHPLIQTLKERIYQLRKQSKE